MAYNKTQKSDFIDLKSIVNSWIKNWYWFVISVVVCLLAALFFLSVRKPQYEVRANLVISSSDENPASMLGGDLGSLLGGNGDVEDEVFVVKSHDVLRKVAVDMGLNREHIIREGFLKKRFCYKNYPVDVVLDPAIADTIRGAFLFDVRVKADGENNVTVRRSDNEIYNQDFDSFPYTVELPWGNFVLVATEYLPADEDLRTKVTYMGYDVAAEKLAKDITADIASQKSNVIQLSMNTPDIEYGKDLLNDIIYQYNEKGMTSKRRQGAQTYAFINARLDSIASQLAMAEAAVRDFKVENKIVDPKTEAQVGYNRREKYEGSLIQAETTLEVIKMTIDFLQNPANANALIPTAENLEHASEAINDYNKMVLERMRLKENAKADNRALKTLEDQLAAMRGNIIASLERARNQQVIAINELKRQVADAQLKLGEIPVQEQQFRDVARRQEIMQTLYVYLLQRQEETAILATSALPKGEIIDNAYALNEPLGMKKKMVLVLAILFGLCIPPVLIYIRSMFRSKFSTREEVEKVLDVPILGEICQSRSAANSPLVVTPTSTSSVAELFRLVRANLNFMLRNKGDKVVLVTSTTSGEGKSFISINLAASLALLGKKVLLVGMDIRNPQLAKYLNIHAKFGLTQYLSSDDVTLDDILLKNPVAENMDIIVAGPVPPNPAELLCEDTVDKFIAEVKGDYDYVIIDSAPVGMVSDTFALDRIADATIYVCRANYTSINHLKFIETIRRQERLKNMALVINGTTTTKGYGYGVNKKSGKKE